VTQRGKEFTLRKRKVQMKTAEQIKALAYSVLKRGFLQIPKVQADPNDSKRRRDLGLCLLRVPVKTKTFARGAVQKFRDVTTSKGRRAQSRRGKQLVKPDGKCLKKTSYLPQKGNGPQRNTALKRNHGA